MKFGKENKEFYLSAVVGKFISGCMQHSEKARGLIFNVLFLLLYLMHVTLHEIILSSAVGLSA